MMTMADMVYGSGVLLIAAFISFHSWRRCHGTPEVTGELICILKPSKIHISKSWASACILILAGLTSSIKRVSFNFSMIFSAVALLWVTGFQVFLGMQPQKLYEKGIQDLKEFYPWEEIQKAEDVEGNDEELLLHLKRHYDNKVKIYGMPENLRQVKAYIKKYKDQ